MTLYFIKFHNMLLLLFVMLTFAETIIFTGKVIYTKEYYIWSFDIHSDFTFNFVLF